MLTLRQAYKTWEVECVHSILLGFNISYFSLWVVTSSIFSFFSLFLFLFLFFCWLTVSNESVMSGGESVGTIFMILDAPVFVPAELPPRYAINFVPAVSVPPVNASAPVVASSLNASVFASAV